MFIIVVISQHHSHLSLSMYMCTLGTSIVAICPNNVNLPSNIALAMCKPNFETKGPPITANDKDSTLEMKKTCEVKSYL
jgi:hypothetical protein